MNSELLLDELEYDESVCAPILAMHAAVEVTSTNLKNLFQSCTLMHAFLVKEIAHIWFFENSS